MIEPIPLEIAEVGGCRKTAGLEPRLEYRDLRTGFEQRVGRGEPGDARSHNCNPRVHRFTPTITTPAVMIRTAIQRSAVTRSRRIHLASTVTST